MKNSSILQTAGTVPPSITNVAPCADATSGRCLVRVLMQSVPGTSGLFLYFPTRTRNQPAMRALIEQVSKLADEAALDVSCKR